MCESSHCDRSHDRVGHEPRPVAVASRSERLGTPRRRLTHLAQGMRTEEINAGRAVSDRGLPAFARTPQRKRNQKCETTWKQPCDTVIIDCPSAQPAEKATAPGTAFPCDADVRPMVIIALDQATTRKYNL